jgi:hypothetical protein
VKHNGPIHTDFYKLLLPEKEGDRFVSFPSMVFEFLSTAARAKSKYDSELKKYHQNIEDGCGPDVKNPLPPMNFFYSLKEMNATRIRKQAAKAKQSGDFEKKKSNAKVRKAKQRQLQKEEDAEVRQKAGKQKKNKRSSRRSRKRVASEAESSSDDDTATEAVSPKKSECARLCRTCSKVRVTGTKPSLVIKPKLSGNTSMTSAFDCRADMTPEDMEIAEIDAKIDAQMRKCGKSQTQYQLLKDDDETPIMEVRQHSLQQRDSAEI